MAATNEGRLIFEVECMDVAELTELGKSNENIRVLYQEVRKLAKELKIVVKVGQFDGFYEREAPRLYSKLLSKKRELDELVNFEDRRSQEVVPPNPFEDAALVGIQGAAQKAYAPPGAQVSVGGPAARNFDQKQKFLMRNFLAYADDNLHLMLVVGLIVFGAQILFNLAYVSRVKSSMQTTMVEPLEERLKASEERNEVLSQNIERMQKQVTYLHSVANRPPPLASKPKSAQHSAKKQTLVHHSRTRKNSERTAQNRYYRN